MTFIVKTIVKTLLQTLFLSCLLVQLTLAAETRMNVRQTGSMLMVEGQLEVPVNQTTAWAVLTDYARFPEFVPGLNSSRLLEERNTSKWVEQRGTVIAGQFRMPFQGVVKIEELRPEGQPGVIRVAFISGPLKDVQGEWNIKPGKPLDLSYRMQMDLMKSPFPPPLAVTIIEQQVRTWVEAFAHEMQVMKRKKE
jgi:ribosome-associated toxin RatA of RatAB toxin-antitoxin module